MEPPVGGKELYMRRRRFRSTRVVRRVFRRRGSVGRRRMRRTRLRIGYRM